jgi:hypothetical protein
MISGSENMVKIRPLLVVMSDPYAYGFDEKSEVRDKLLTDWARIGLTKMADILDRTYNRICPENFGVLFDLGNRMNLKRAQQSNSRSTTAE